MLPLEMLLATGRWRACPLSDRAFLTCLASDRIKTTNLQTWSPRVLSFSVMTVAGGAPISPFDIFILGKNTSHNFSYCFDIYVFRFHAQFFLTIIYVYNFS
jgi:hypothetical protein